MLPAPEHGRRGMRGVVSTVGKLALLLLLLFGLGAWYRELWGGPRAA